VSSSHLTPATQILASNLHSREELCCKKVIINAFEQPLQQGVFNQKKAVKGRLLDTLPKPVNHPGVGFCSAWLSLLSRKRIGWRPQTHLDFLRETGPTLLPPL
jgi:hypothetical protein